MKKILNINLSGRVIPIEDTAYEKLQSYVESLRRYFVNEEGRDEIINDIESRIAELMNDKIVKGASCITDADVDEIAASMGRPQDFEAEAANETAEPKKNTTQDYTYTEKRTKRRLYRDSSDKFIGGVCSGIANYLNTDPAIVRILFAIITFGGFGVGFLLYILLWIFLPNKDLEGYSGKRLYRNPEDKIIGGVAGGLAAYFNMRASTIRIIFAAPMIISIFFRIIRNIAWHYDFVPNIFFGSLSGTFILAYIILWMVLPEAKSTYEKMEMRGEKVDVNAIRQTVQERAKEFGEEVKNTADNISGKAREFANTKGRAFATEVSETVRPAARGLGHAIGVLFKVFFLFIAGTIAFSLFVVLLAFLFGGVELMPFKNYLFDGFWQNAFAWGTLIFFLCVPLIAFLTWLVRRMMKIKSHRSYLGWIFGGLWVLGWISVTMFVSYMVRDFRNTERIKDEVVITQPVSGRMTVRVNEPEIRYNGPWWWVDDECKGFDINRDSLKMSNVKIRILKSSDSEYHVNVFRYSAGMNPAMAGERAKKIRFNSSYEEGNLNLGSGFAIDVNSKFRMQRVLVEIEVPIGKKIRFDESLEVYNPFDVRISEKRQKGWKRSWNKDYELEWDWDKYFNWDINVDYIMGSNGELINPDKPANDSTRNKNNYRYENKQDLEQSIKEREQKVEEERKKIEEDKKKLKDSTLSGKNKFGQRTPKEAYAMKAPTTDLSLINILN